VPKVPRVPKVLGDKSQITTALVLNLVKSQIPKGAEFTWNLLFEILNLRFVIWNLALRLRSGTKLVIWSLELVI